MRQWVTGLLRERAGAPGRELLTSPREKSHSLPPIPYPMKILRAAALVLALALLFPLVGRAGMEEVSEEPGTLYILAIGIDRYTVPGHDGPWQDLNGCKNDATAVADLLASKAVPAYKRVDKQVILDRDATRSRVESAMNRIIAESRPDDTLIFYFAGNADSGTLERKETAREFSLAMSDANQDGPESGIPGRLLKSWLSKAQAGHELVILDASYADRAVQVLQSHVEQESREELALADRDMLAIAPSGMEGETKDEKGVTHGLFTLALLRGLSGPADAFPKDGRITAWELQAYMYGALAELNAQGYSQHPASWVVGKNFPLLVNDPVLASRSRGFAVTPEAPPAQVPAAAVPRDYALLIAGDQYSNPAWPRLSNPVFDANTIAQDLKENYGFETQVVANPTLQKIYDTLREYNKTTFSDDDQLFIFIAGHGYYDEVAGEGYVIASDSAAPGDDLPRTAYPFSLLRDAVDHIHAKHIFLVMDVCFGGTFDQRITEAASRGGEGEYQEVSKVEFVKRKMKYETRRYLTSGGKEYVGDGRPGQHSPFARDLLEALRGRGDKNGVLDLSRLYQYVEKAIPEPRAGEFGHNAPGSDFLFIVGGPQGAADAAPN